MTLFLTTALWGQYCPHPHFSRKKLRLREVIHFPKFTGSKLGLNSDLSHPRANHQNHSTLSLLSWGSSPSCGETEARERTSLAVVSSLLPESMETPALQLLLRHF